MTRICFLILVALSLVLAPGNCLGQQPAAPAEDPPDPKVVLLNQAAEEGDERQLARTIQELIRLNAWKDAQQWLESVASIDDLVVLGEMAERIDPSTLLKALNQPGLSVWPATASQKSCARKRQTR